MSFMSERYWVSIVFHILWQIVIENYNFSNKVRLVRHISFQNASHSTKSMSYQKKSHLYCMKYSYMVKISIEIKLSEWVYFQGS